MWYSGLVYRYKEGFGLEQANKNQKEKLSDEKANFLTIAVLTIVLLLGANLATALEPIPQEAGFGGFIRPAVGYLKYKSNMVASIFEYDLSDETNDSLTDSPDSQSTGIVIVPFTLAYTFASTRTQLFLGTDLTDLIRLDYTQQIGVKQGIGNLGVLQGGFLFSSIPTKVWKDPYLTNQDRIDTKIKETRFTTKSRRKTVTGSKAPFITKILGA